jgi:hypothetical protein
MEVSPPSVDTINADIREELSMLIESMMANPRDDRRTCIICSCCSGSY